MEIFLILLGGILLFILSPFILFFILYAIFMLFYFIFMVLYMPFAIIIKFLEMIKEKMR